MTNRAKRAAALMKVWRLILIFALVFPSGVNADSVAEEYSVKAAFLFHFAQFVEWPETAFASPGSPLTYCTLGQDPFHGALDATLSGKTIGGRPLQVVHLKASQDLQNCHVLFLGASEKKSIPVALSSLKGKPVLTIGETGHFVDAGGVIGFSLDENKIRFEINLGAAETAKLRINSRLLSLAKQVVGAHGGT
ncbi:MAG TPA: YfiR family protein [Methylomirabilota bacterium]|nr:YfiR family protein [Methylomirabilota bacterium]